MPVNLKIRKGDDVIVTSGRDRGKRGEVLRVYPKESRVLVRGVNLIRRHTKPSAVAGPGGIIEKEAPLHISNVALTDPKSDGATRVGYKTLKGGRKVRVARKSGEVIDL